MISSVYGKTSRLIDVRPAAARVSVTQQLCVTSCFRDSGSGVPRLRMHLRLRMPHVFSPRMSADRYRKLCSSQRRCRCSVLSVFWKLLIAVRGCRIDWFCPDWLLYCDIDSVSAAPLVPGSLPLRTLLYSSEQGERLPAERDERLPAVRSERLTLTLRRSVCGALHVFLGRPLLSGVEFRLVAGGIISA